MPELPDVAGFKKYLDATSLHQKIRTTRCHDDRFVKGLSRQSLQRRLKGTKLTGSRQWGKWLFVAMDAKGYLVLHFGMTGGLDYGAGDPPEHARLVLHFDNDKRLAILSQRMIGRASWTDDLKAFGEQHELGPDALDIDADRFVEMFRSKRGAVKSALMDQSLIAGIGNVYSDEICFQTRMHPGSKVPKLGESRLRDLQKAMRRVLSVASRKGGNGHKAPRSWLLGGRGEDSPCPRCGGNLDSTTINGRTSWFCPACQPAP